MLLKNCVDWVCFDLAAQSLGLVVVPLYTADHAENTANILADSEARLLLGLLIEQHQPNHIFPAVHARYRRKSFPSHPDLRRLNRQEVHTWNSGGI